MGGTRLGLSKTSVTCIPFQCFDFLFPCRIQCYYSTINPLRGGCAVIMMPLVLYYDMLLCKCLLCILINASFCISSECIRKSVSILHECGTSYVFRHVAADTILYHLCGILQICTFEALSLSIHVIMSKAG